MIYVTLQIHKYNDIKNYINQFRNKIIWLL